MINRSPVSSGYGASIKLLLLHCRSTLIFVNPLHYEVSVASYVCAWMNDQTGLQHHLRPHSTAL